MLLKKSKQDNRTVPVSTNSLPYAHRCMGVICYYNAMLYVPAAYSPIFPRISNVKP